MATQTHPHDVGDTYGEIQGYEDYFASAARVLETDGDYRGGAIYILDTEGIYDEDSDNEYEGGGFGQDRPEENIDPEDLYRFSEEIEGGSLEGGSLAQFLSPDEDSDEDADDSADDSDSKDSSVQGGDDICDEYLEAMTGGDDICDEYLEAMTGGSLGREIREESTTALSLFADDDEEEGPCDYVLVDT